MGEDIDLKDLKNQLSILPEKKLLDILPGLRISAGPDLVPILLDRWLNCRDEILRDSLFQFFADSKNQDELIHYTEAMRSEKFSAVKNKLISILWLSSLDASGCIGLLIQTALTGNIECLIEVITVVENIEKKAETNQIQMAKQQIESAIVSEKNSDRRNLLSHLHHILNNMELN